MDIQTINPADLEDFRNEILNFIEPAPRLKEWFSTDKEKHVLYVNDIDSVKYFDDEFDLDINKLQTKIGQSNLNISQFGTYLDEPNIISHPHLSEKSNNIVTTEKILSVLMCTPFLITNNMPNWTMYAHWDNDNIKLYSYDNAINENTDIKVADRLKRYLFFKKPFEQHRNTISLEDRLFYGLFCVKVGDNKVYYSGEICGVNTTASNEDLDKAEYYFLDAVPITSNEPLTNVNIYNPLWWSQAKLINAKHCIIGFYNKSVDNLPLQQILKFSRVIFDSRTIHENMWSPLAAWIFLKKFLVLLRKEANAIKPEERDNSLWIFESKKNATPTVTCSISTITYQN